MKEKVTATFIVILMILILSGMMYMAITNPYEYPGYELTPPPNYSPWPAA